MTSDDWETKYKRYHKWAQTRLTKRTKALHNARCEIKALEGDIVKNRGEAWNRESELRVRLYKGESTLSTFEAVPPPLSNQSFIKRILKWSP